MNTIINLYLNNQVLAVIVVSTLTLAPLCINAIKQGRKQIKEMKK